MKTAVILWKVATLGAMAATAAGVTSWLALAIAFLLPDLLIGAWMVVLAYEGRRLRKAEERAANRPRDYVR